MDIQALIGSHLGQNLKLYDCINPQFAKVLALIGFNKTFVRAAGSSLFDVDGNEYLDFLSGFGVYAIGRNHPEMKKAIQDYLNMDFPNLIQMEAPLLCGLLAEKMIKIFGHDVRDKVFFTNSGTEAVEAALKFAKGATGRKKFLHFEHAFHGLTTGSLAVNGNAEFRDGFGELLPADAVLMNDLDVLEKKLKSEEYAAFIFEPIQGKGVYVVEKDYLKHALILCRKYGTLSIADEIQCGIGRTGDWLTIDGYDAEPDMVVLSKALSGGFVQAGALLYKTDVYNKIFSRMDRCVVHSSTFGKNNLSMVCGLTALEIIEKENLCKNAKEMGQLFLSELKNLQKKHDEIQDVRGRGLMIGLEFGKPSSFKKKLVWQAVHKIDKGLFGELIVMPLMQKYRILTQVSGHHQDIIKLIPPLVITEKQIHYFIDSLDAVLNEGTKITGSMLTMGKNLAKHVFKNKASV